MKTLKVPACVLFVIRDLFCVRVCAKMRTVQKFLKMKKCQLISFNKARGS